MPLAARSPLLPSLLLLLRCCGGAWTSGDMPTTTLECPSCAFQKWKCNSLCPHGQMQKVHTTFTHIMGGCIELIPAGAKTVYIDVDLWCAEPVLEQFLSCSNIQAYEFTEIVQGFDMLSGCWPLHSDPGDILVEEHCHWACKYGRPFGRCAWTFDTGGLFDSGGVSTLKQCWIAEACDEDRCVDHPTNWNDAAGDPCHIYGGWDLCTQSGGYGSGWKLEYGSFADWLNEGVSASEACCECGGGSATKMVEVVCEPMDLWAEASLTAEQKAALEQQLQMMHLSHSGAHEALKQALAAVNMSQELQDAIWSMYNSTIAGLLQKAEGGANDGALEGEVLSEGEEGAHLDLSEELRRYKEMLMQERARGDAHEETSARLTIAVGVMGGLVVSLCATVVLLCIMRKRSSRVVDERGGNDLVVIGRPVDDSDGASIVHGLPPVGGADLRFAANGLESSPSQMAVTAVPLSTGGKADLPMKP